MTDLLLKNFALLDAAAGELRSGYQVLVQGDTIGAVEKGRIDAAGAREIDLGGRTLMPGMIDCHVHINRYLLPPAPVALPSLIAATAGQTLKGMLMNGFTTVRDAGGADAGFKQAIDLGLFQGPRLFVSGRALSQTGGHGDRRSPADLVAPCDCVHLEAGMGRIADGVSEVRKAVRDEIRLGADQIKVMAGGGVTSQSDPIDQLQYSMEELKAIVDEATRSNTYVLAHVFVVDGIRRCMEAGVRTIEHGFFLDEDTARAMIGTGTYLVPNLLTLEIIANGLHLGYTPLSVEKARDVLEYSTRALEIATHVGVKIAFGTDMSRASERMPEEILARARIQKPADIIRSLTLIGAEVVRLPGRVGVVAPGAFADLLAIDGDPFADLGLLASSGRDMAMIMKAGTLYKQAL